MSNQNIAQNNEQILNDIQALQEMERQLLNNLESNVTTLTPQQQEQTIEKINQISNMRINLYQTLSSTNQYFQGALSSSVVTLQQQAVAIDIIEIELNNSKKRLDLLETEKLNKIRLVEINDYYGDKYADHAQFMKIVIFTLIPIIIISVLHNKSILPDTPYYILLVLISIVGAFYMWRSFSSIIMRDNMNYQAYNWTFNPKTAPSGTATTTSSASDPWAASINIGTCVGQECCSDGQTWDTSMNQCTGTSTVTEPFGTESFVTESMIQKSLSKKQPNKHKSDYKIGNNYKAPQSGSFIKK
ncbi:MAG: hypothetical protein MUP82_06515 [Candidatus Marinimicrobia bacterium]|nr:hypothetical protein [Candidatus Neomarinimicrobiota bacterium]